MRDSEAPPGASQRGSALLFAMFVIVLLTAMGLALLFLTQNELNMTRASMGIKEAFYFAEGGVEDGRRTLFDTNGSGSFDDDLVAAAGPDGVIDLVPGNLRPVFDGGGNVTGFSGADDDVPLRGLTLSEDGVYAAYLSNDPIDGRGNQVDTNDRVMVSGIGVGPQNAVEIVEAIVEPEHLLPALPPAAITLMGFAPQFLGGTSNSSAYSGVDCGGAGIPNPYVPTVGVFFDNAESFAEAGVVPNGPDYVSDPALADPLDTIANLNDPAEPLVGSATDPAWSDCQSLIDLIESLRPVANHLCVGAGCTMPPGGTGPGYVTFIDNGGAGGTVFDVDPDGEGVLVVTGKVLRGNRSWRGIVLAIGQGVLERSGAGNGIISGSVIVADVAGMDGLYGTADDCGLPSDGFHRSDYHVNGGGNGDTQYCSDDITNADPAVTYKVVEFLQH